MDENKHTLKPPKNTELPFFAYGIFKPGQLAYSKIKEYTVNYYCYQIDYDMLMRDGVPFIVPSEYSKTHGFLIYFEEKYSKKAYEIISKTEPKKLYKWCEIKVGENKANVLMGRKPDKGSSYIEGNRRDYDGRQDPFFKEALEVVEKELKDEKIWHNIEDFFKLQMAYMLLWAAIERYCSLKYNAAKIWQKNEELSKEEIFKKSLKKHVQSQRTVYSSENLRKFTLNAEKPFESLEYYYTIRCNVVHRGKAMYNDSKMLKQSLGELLNIFRDVLDDTFDSDD